jgi:broad specificity phosphatase PhoE
MAQRVADHFAVRYAGQVDLLVASPLERAQETAAPIAEALGLPIRTDPRVIESGSHLAGRRTDLKGLLHPGSLRWLYNPLRPSWGEPFEQIADRMAEVLAELRQEIPDGQVVVVSHQSPVWRARRREEGRTVWPMPRGRACSLASVTSLTYEGEKLSAVGYYEPAADLLPERLR